MFNTIYIRKQSEEKLHRESGQNKKEKRVSLMLIYKKYCSKIYKKRKAIFSYIRKIP